MKLLNRLKDAGGYIAIETIILTGLMFTLGAAGMVLYFEAAKVVVEEGANGVLQGMSLQPGQEY